MKKLICIRHTQYLEIQQSIQLVLNNGQRLDQLLRAHGTHHSVNPKKTTHTGL